MIFDISSWSSCIKTSKYQKISFLISFPFDVIGDRIWYCDKHLSFLYQILIAKNIILTPPSDILVFTRGKGSSTRDQHPHVFPRGACSRVFSGVTSGLWFGGLPLAVRWITCTTALQNFDLGCSQGEGWVVIISDYYNHSYH